MIELLTNVVGLLAIIAASTLALRTFRSTKQRTPGLDDGTAVVRPTLLSARRRFLLAVISTLAALSALLLVVSTPKGGRQPTRATLDSLRIADSIKSARRKMADDSLGAGVSLARSGHLAAAIRKYSAAIALDSMNTAAYNLKGYALLKLGKVSDAVSALRRSVAIDSTYPWGYYNLSLAEWAGGDTVAATSTILHLLRTNPEFRGTILHDKQFRRIRQVPAIQHALQDPY